MAPRKAPKSLFGPYKNSITTLSFVDANGKGWKATISLDIANDDFLQPLSFDEQNWFQTPFQDFKPSSAEYKALLASQEFQTIYKQQIRLYKDRFDRLSSRDEKDVLAAAGRAGTQQLWEEALNTANPYLPQPSKVGVSTAESVTTVQIGASEDDVAEFIQSITGDKKIISLKYPEDALYGSGQDYLAIEQFTYRAPQFLEDKGAVTGFLDALTKGLSRGSNLNDYIGLVRLPIPNNLSMSNSVDWGDSRVNPVEAGAFYTAFDAANRALSGNVGSLLSGTFSGFGDFIDKVKGGSFAPDKNSGMLLSAFLAQYGLGRVGINVDPAQFIARGTGNTINPNLELLFSGPKLRNFAFQFRFAPNSDTEASICRKIMRFFKQGMAARRIREQTLFLGSPNVFRLRYLTGNNDPIRALPRYKICALTATEVDYAPGGLYQSYEDKKAGSQPTIMNMTLNFTELTPIFEQDYRNFDSAESQKDLFSKAGGELGEINKINTEDVGF